MQPARSQKPLVRTQSITGVIFLTVVTSSNALAEEIQVGRYASVRPVPTLDQVDLLRATIRVRFPESVRTVGQAMEFLLRPSGYRFSLEAVEASFKASLWHLPLPQPHRVLGPMDLRTALETLAGPAFRLVEDPVHRLVTFERCKPGEADASTVSARVAR